jgi:hypothetical protein
VVKGFKITVRLENEHFLAAIRVLKPFTHRSLDLTPPATIGRDEQIVSRSPSVEVERRDRLGGLIHEYSHAA